MLLKKSCDVKYFHIHLCNMKEYTSVRTICHKCTHPTQTGTALQNYSVIYFAATWGSGESFSFFLVDARLRFCCLSILVPTTLKKVQETYTVVRIMSKGHFFFFFLQYVFLQVASLKVVMLQVLEPKVSQETGFVQMQLGYISFGHIAVNHLCFSGLPRWLSG